MAGAWLRLTSRVVCEECQQDEEKHVSTTQAKVYFCLLYFYSNKKLDFFLSKNQKIKQSEKGP